MITLNNEPKILICRKCNIEFICTFACKDYGRISCCCDECELTSCKCETRPITDADRVAIEL